MEEELAAVEEDVERKRVSKNPFEQKFTALTESPFADPGDGDGQEMENLSRQILVRMEVISKQIAFLSKETAGQPDKVPVNNGPGQPQAQAVGNDNLPDKPSALDGDVRTRQFLPESHNSITSGESRLGSSLSARVDMFRRRQQGLATAKELLPSDILAYSLRNLTLVDQPCNHHRRPVVSPVGMPAANSENDQLIANSNGRRVSATTRKRTTDRNTGSKKVAGTSICQYVPPGVLHQFIKHVKPFSLCVDESTARQSPSLGAAPRRETGNAGGPVDLGDGVDELDKAKSEDGGCVAEKGGRRILVRTHGSGANPGSFSSPNPSTAFANSTRNLAASTERPQSGSGPGIVGGGGGGGGGCGDGPRKSHKVDGEFRRVRPAEARLQGRRKLAYPPSTAAPDSNDGGSESPEGRAATSGRPPCANEGRRQQRAPERNRRGGDKREAKKKSGFGESKELDFTSLSWESAKSFRKRMESVMAAKHPLTIGSTTRKKKDGKCPGNRRGGDAGAAQRITLDDDPAISGRSTSSSTLMGTLNLVHSNGHVEVPEIATSKGSQGYLASLANPMRDLKAMKKAFEQRCRSVSGEPDISADIPPAFPTKPSSERCEGDPSEDCNVDTAMECEDLQLHPPDDQDSGEFRDNSRAARSVVSNGVRPRVTDSKPGGTCMIDLKNIWQRTAAMSQTISQAVKLSDKRKTLLTSLRDSFANLDLRHRQQQQRRTAGGSGFQSGVGAKEHSRAVGDVSAGISATHKMPATTTETAISIRLSNDPREEQHKPSSDGPGATESLPQQAASPAIASDTPIVSALGEGGDAGTARMFALIVSLAHVHNISSTSSDTSTALENGGSGTPFEAQSSSPSLLGSAASSSVRKSQLHIRLKEGAYRAIVTAK